MSTENLAARSCPQETACPSQAKKSGGRLPSWAAFIGTALIFAGITFAAGAPSPLYVLFQQQWHFPAWILTVAFAIYAITLLVTLLVAGSLSDHIGRRPVLIGALLLEAVAMALFVVAPDIGWIIAARALQGVATGAATSTLTASVVELAPLKLKKIGSLVSGTAPIGGLALGALVTGFAVQFSRQPSLLVFSILVVLFVLGTVLVVFSPETVTPRPGAWGSLIPRLAVAATARVEFASSIPVLVATWMFGGLFLGLAPSILRGVFHLDSGLVNGALVALTPASGTAASLLLGKLAPRKTILVGTAVVLAGIALVTAGIALGQLTLLFVGAVLGGSGFGASFYGIMRILAPLAKSHQRAELFAAIYLVCYLAFGIPALAAGLLTGVFGLANTILGYGSVAILVALVGLAGQLRLAKATRTDSQQ